MYEDLIKSLRACGMEDGTVRCVACKEEFVLGCSCSNTLMRKAADAIEKLEAQLKAARKTLAWLAEPIEEADK